MIDLDYNNHNFTKRKITITAILNGNYWQGRLPEEERAYFEQMINDHHRSHGSTIIHSVVITPHPFYKHNNFVADYTIDDVRVTDIIGVGSTLSKTPNRNALTIKRSKAIQFMRYIVGFDMTKIRQGLVNNDPHCNLCGVEVTESNSHLDHCGDHEFRHLADIWLDGYLDRITMVSNPGACNKFDNPALTDEWIEFHHMAAQMQLLCAPCNLKKAKV